MVDQPPRSKNDRQTPADLARRLERRTQPPAPEPPPTVPIADRDGGELLAEIHEAITRAFDFSARSHSTS